MCKAIEDMTGCHDGHELCWYEGEQCPACKMRKVLRDDFAGQAMAAFFQEHTAHALKDTLRGAEVISVCFYDQRVAAFAKQSYKMSDAMLKAREVDGGGTGDVPNDTPKGD